MSETATVQAPEYKIYVLLSELDNNAPIYQQVGGGKRDQLKKRPMFPLYNQVTFQDESGENRNIRFMNRANSIFLEDQIKAGLDANAKYVPKDRSDLNFRNGMLGTNNKLAIKYLDTFPGNESFKGICDAVPTPIYKELNLAADTKKLSTDFLKRLKAANKIAAMDGNVGELSALLIRLNGISFITPEDPGDLLAMAIDYLDDADDGMLDFLLKEELTVDESTSVLIGKLVNSGLLKFDADGAISKMKNGKWLLVRNMSKELSQEAKEASFIEYLNSEDGKSVRSEFEAEIKKVIKFQEKQVAASEPQEPLNEEENKEENKEEKKSKATKTT